MALWIKLNHKRGNVSGKKYRMYWEKQKFWRKKPGNFESTTANLSKEQYHWNRQKKVSSKRDHVKLKGKKGDKSLVSNKMFCHIERQALKMRQNQRNPWLCLHMPIQSLLRSTGQRVICWLAPCMVPNSDTAKASPSSLIFSMETYNYQVPNQELYWKRTVFSGYWEAFPGSVLSELPG